MPHLWIEDKNFTSYEDATTFIKETYGEAEKHKFEEAKISCTVQGRKFKYLVDYTFADKLAPQDWKNILYMSKLVTGKERTHRSECQLVLYDKDNNSEEIEKFKTILLRQGLFVDKTGFIKTNPISTTSQPSTATPTQSTSAKGGWPTFPSAEWAQMFSKENWPPVPSSSSSSSRTNYIPYQHVQTEINAMIVVPPNNNNDPHVVNSNNNNLQRTQPNNKEEKQEEDPLDLK